MAIALGAPVTARQFVVSNLIPCEPTFVLAAAAKLAGGFPSRALLPPPVALDTHCSARAATIGNWIGGAVCMATVYACVYGRPAKQLAAWLEARERVATDGTGSVDGVVAVDMAGDGSIKQH
jgi:hypothetical protein